MLHSVVLILHIINIRCKDRCRSLHLLLQSLRALGSRQNSLKLFGEIFFILDLLYKSFISPFAWPPAAHEDDASTEPDSKGNIRDEATLKQLIVLVNMESMNAELIKLGLPQYERAIRLNRMAIEQINSLNAAGDLPQLEKMK